MSLFDGKPLTQEDVEANSVKAPVKKEVYWAVDTPGLGAYVKVRFGKGVAVYVTLGRIRAGEKDVRLWESPEALEEFQALKKLKLAPSDNVGTLVRLDGRHGAESYITVRYWEYA